MVRSSLPPLSSIESAKLREVAQDFSLGDVIEAKKLFAERPVLFFMVRRTGCPACRELAHELSMFSDVIRDEYGVDIVAIVKEVINEDLEGFRTFFGGRVFLDSEMNLYRALTGGKLIKNNVLLTLFRPSVWNGLKRASSKGIKAGSLAGEASINGGFLLASSKAVHYKINEEVGHLPSFDDLMQQIRAVSPNAGVTDVADAVNASGIDGVSAPNAALQRPLCTDVCVIPAK
ncbi:hypothetical protein MP638_002025 [Amoeboaphelidium occidentale]|nr:hypothetical protein MP638_002025 [Amoeboaphelidium occidentale]